MLRKAPFARTTTSRGSSSTIPSTADSNTVRRRSSDSRRVSFARWSRDRAMSVSRSAASFWSSASWTARCDCVPRTWFTRMRSATAAARTPIRSEAWRSSITELRLSTATRARAALVAATERVVRTALPYRAGSLRRSVTLRGITLTSTATNRAANAIGRSTSGRPISNDALSHSSANPYTPTHIPQTARNIPRCATLGRASARAP
jgi:hypothetical protein